VSTGTQNKLTLERIEKIVGELASAYEDLLNGDSIAAPAHIRAVVAEWSSVVMPAIDARIIKCHELVKRGLRDEALGYAAEPPDLFDAVKLLDLERFGRANYSAWMGGSQAAGLLLPPPPQLDKFGEIEAARDCAEKLSPLLEQWRRLNIQRAPLPLRIRMLNTLLQRDSDLNNPVWQAMLAEHEKHRLTEITAILGRLREHFENSRDADAGDLEREVDLILAELRGKWRTLQPSIALSEQATRLIAEVRQQRIDTTLNGLVSLLESHHAGLKTDRSAAKNQLHRHFDAWNEALAERGVIDPADPWLTRVRPILEYVERLREHESLVVEVGQRVAERPVTSASRISWAQALDRMMDGIDETASLLPAADIDPQRIAELSNRVAHIAESVRKEAFIWRMTTMATVVSVLFAVAAGAWTLYSSKQHQRAVESALADCASAVKSIEARETSDANVGDSWNATVRDDPAVKRGLGRVVAAQHDEELRREALKQQLDDIRSALADLQNAARPDPLAPWPNAFTRVTALLAESQAKNLAILDEEQAALEGPRAKARAKAKEFGDAANDAFIDRVGRLEGDLRSLEIAMANNLGGSAPSIEPAVTELERLRLLAGSVACPGAEEGYGQQKLVSIKIASLVAAESKVASLLNTLRTRVAMIAGLAAREEKADRLLAGGRHAEYADALRSIAADIGPSPIARDYAAVAENHAAWQALADWTGFVTSLKNPAEMTATEATAAIEKLQALAPETMRLPTAKAASIWLEPALKRFKGKTDEDLKVLREDLVRRLNGTYGEALDGVISAKGSTEYPRYYVLLRDRPLPDARKRIDYVTGLPDARKNWPTKQLSFDPDKHLVVDSPQKRHAENCKNLLKREAAAGPTKLDEIAVAFIKSCAAPSQPADGEPGIDPCLHAILVRFLVDQTSKNRPDLAPAFAKSLALINCGNTPEGPPIMIHGVDNDAFAAVLNPEQQNSDAWIQTQRTKCADFLRVVIEEADAAETAVAEKSLLLSGQYRALRRFRCVGRIRKFAEGGWGITGGDAAMRSGKEMLTIGGGLDSCRLVPCATCDQKGAIPFGTDVKARAGDLLYVEVQDERNN